MSENSASAVEVIRRTTLWAGVAAFFVATVWHFVAFGEPTGLFGFPAFPVVGAVILTSRRGNGVGWYLYAIGLLTTITTAVRLVGGIGDLGGLVRIDPDSSAVGPAWLETVDFALSWPLWVLLPLVGLIFPTGRVTSRFGRVIWWQLVGLAILTCASGIVTNTALPLSGRPNPFAVPALGPVPGLIVDTPGYLYFAALVLCVLVELGRRWPRAQGAERLQYRWLMLGLVSTGIVIVTTTAVNLIFPNFHWVAIWSGLGLIGINFIPISIGIAVTRYGLYAIGRVISRTVSYAIVTLIVVGVYALFVVSITTVLPDLPAIGVALATLAAAAIFLPVLRWVQSRVDRRFDRERYDAQKVVDAFGEHLRTDIDPGSASGELVEAVEQTLQPVSVGLWTSGGRR